MDDLTRRQRIERRYNELLNDATRVNHAIPDAADAGLELGDYLYRVATEEIDEETT